MNRDRLDQLLNAFGNTKILVIGDLMLDEFIWGNVRRISPEAPVPVVEVVRQSYFPGGSANVARNLREFSSHVSVMGLIGTCAHAGQLRALLTDNKIDLGHLLEFTGYQTIVKTRIIAGHQQVVRVDREKKVSLTPAQTDFLVKRIEESVPGLNAIIFEDYGKGLLQQELVDRIIAIARKAGVTITVDPNPNNRLRWHEVTAITPNRSEAFAAAGRPWTDPIDPPVHDAELLEVGKVLLERWATENLLITLGEHGMMLFRPGQSPFHIPTRAREVFDVSGAGDTAIALFTLALSAKATPPEAAEISNHASGIVVGKLGTAVVTREELIQSFETHAR
ncbi:MAG TPA: PfkB family carbohydrate kinase [Chthoniobacteraceae bacterium]|nr:PfkB family carbohydrate kinase [Chthoniobacteraceae bacterium]